MKPAALSTLADVWSRASSVRSREEERVVGETGVAKVMLQQLLHTQQVTAVETYMSEKQKKPSFAPCLHSEAVLS